MRERLDRTQFEENTFWNLQDKFIDKNTNLWNSFVDEEYQSYLEDFEYIQELEVEDYLLEQSRDKELEELNKKEGDNSERADEKEE